MDDLQRNLLEDIQKILEMDQDFSDKATSQLNTNLSKEIDSTFTTMISALKDIRVNLSTIFNTNVIIGESVTPYTFQRLDETLQGLIQEFERLR